jgi:PAS domain S-box-containing protein
VTTKVGSEPGTDDVTPSICYAVGKVERDRLELLWEDGERVFCQAWRNAEDGRRACVAVLPAAEYPAPSSIERLTHEYGLRDFLDHSWAVRPLELVRERGRTMLLLEPPVLEPARALPLDRFVSEPLELRRFLQLAVSVSAALRQMHRRGLVHRDIKPANILVDPATDQIWLTGFGIASRLPRERQPPEPPELIAGTLAYMAPEQTGRMNRSIDSRCDLYALGVTLYQLLSGSLPFLANDPMEWVHCHIARMPAPPKSRTGEDVPAQLSAMLLKLLAKTPDERYQTAEGVERDLRRCLHDWETLHTIGSFPLGERDTADRLLLPERLYGREREVAALLDAFAQVVASGTPRLVVVRGQPGVGKSSVIDELHKAIVPSRGLFASGKFNQLQHDVPYASLVEALRGLTRRLLGKPEAELASFRDELLRQLDSNGGLVVELIPELEFIIGEQQPVRSVPAPAAKVRFQLALRRLIGVFARPRRPLVLFLDDIQWLDAATLDLLGDLLVQPDVRHLLVIGAYRDNEVDSGHPLALKLAAISGGGAAVQEIALAPLEHSDLTRLIADALRCDPESASPLARVVHDKTAGNPFFANQFLDALVEDELIVFDPDPARWSWELWPIQVRGYTENVLDLMVGKLNRLPPATQEALKELACLGSVAPAHTLAIAHETSQDELHADLWEALRLGLVVRAEDSYRFVHDRVQEAAYSLLREDARELSHLRIGRLLVEHQSHEQREESVFVLVGQLNRGSALIDSKAERERVAELNLSAGKRAQAAAAHASALKYLATGGALVDDDWTCRHALLFELTLRRAECEFLTGDVAAAEARSLALSPRCADAAERAQVVCLLADVYVALQQLERSIEVCLDFLRWAGLELPAQPTDAQARAAYDQISQVLDGRSIEELVDLPLMSDPASRATLDVLAKIVRCAATRLDKNLLCLILCAAVELSIERGHCDSSSYVYASFGVNAGWQFGDFEAGFRFGRLGHDLIERKGLRQFESLVCLTLASRVMPWAKHVEECRGLIRKAFDLANKSGDRVSAVSSCCVLVSNLLLAGAPLIEAANEAESGRAFCGRSAFRDFIGASDTQAAFIRSLRGLTREFGCLDDERFDEARMEQHFATQPHAPVFECWYWIRKLQARYLAGDWIAARDAAARARAVLSSSRALLEAAEYEFYAGLTEAALCESASADELRQHIESATSHHALLERWARHCPENFEHRATLVAAELARIKGQELHAMRLYEHATRSARDHGFVHDEALATELAARFYAAREFEKIARAYMRDARAGYLQWGAAGKVRKLEERYPYLRDENPSAGPTLTAFTPFEQLELATVVRVLQAVSGEIDLAKLVATVMKLALSHAGAERGLLILPRGEGFRIEAEARTAGDTVSVTLRHADVTAGDLPESAFQYVLRTRERVLLNDAGVDGPFFDDPYWLARPARSVLCLPLFKQARLVGVLYLENNLTTGVFTPARLALLELLASEAAISLENSRLYSELREREARVRRLVEANVIGIVIASVDGRILEANDAFLRIVGYDRVDLAAGNLRWVDMTPPEWRRTTEQRVAELRLTGVTEPHELEFFRKDGSRAPVLVGTAMFDDWQNEGVAFVVDLTERRQAEEAARESDRRYNEIRAQLAHANRVATVGQLSASIAHEVNQPLSGILVNAATCLRMLAADPPNLSGAAETVRRAIRDANRASDVIQRLRALFTKTDSTPSELLDLNEAIRDVLALSRAELQSRRVVVRLRFAEALPLVRGDRIQLQQLLLNLVKNAVDSLSASEEGSRQVSISTELAGGDVQVAIEDSGPGIEPANLGSIFEAFYSTKPGGLGVGLSICRAIVEAHRGTLSAKPASPHGAIFQFTLPVAPA